MNVEIMNYKVDRCFEQNQLPNFSIHN